MGSKDSYYKTVDEYVSKVEVAQKEDSRCLIYIFEFFFASLVASAPYFVF